MRTIVDRYHRVGLGSNPFATELHPELHPSLFVGRGLNDPLNAGPSSMVQVIGDKGAGKTSQLMAWRDQTLGPYHYVPPRPYVDRWARPPVAPVVYGDEIDRMPVLLRSLWFRRLARAGSTVIIGTHADLAYAARRAGLDVVTHQLGRADLALMTKVFERRFEQVVIDRGSSLRLSDDVLADIHRKSNGSLRAAEVLGHEAVANHVLDPHTERSRQS